jgi:hypothetical protein
MNSQQAQAEFAAHAAGLTGYRSLANKTGLRIETVAALGETRSLDVLFANGKLRDSTELRNLEAAGGLTEYRSSGRNPQRCLRELDEIRWAPGLSPQQKLMALLEMMREWH